MKIQFLESWQHKWREEEINTCVCGDLYIYIYTVYYAQNNFSLHALRTNTMFYNHRQVESSYIYIYIYIAIRSAKAYNQDIDKAYAIHVKEQ
jgi:hypothetical protein